MEIQLPLILLIKVVIIVFLFLFYHLFINSTNIKFTYITHIFYSDNKNEDPAFAKKLREDKEVNEAAKINADKKAEFTGAPKVQRQPSMRRNSTGDDYKGPAGDKDNRSFKNGKAENGSDVVRASRRHSLLTAKDHLEKKSSETQSASIRVSAMHQKRLENKVADSRTSRARQEGFTGGDVTTTSSKTRKSVLLTYTTEDVLKKSLKEHPIFSNMDAGQLQCIVDAMVLEQIPAGKILTVQGSPGKKWFCIHTGTFEISSQGETRKDDIHTELGPGDGFGEIFLFDCPRVFTVSAKTDGSVWSISRQNYRQVLKNYEEQNANQRIRFLREVKLFATLTSKELEAIADEVVEETILEGEYIMKQNDSVDEYSKFYIISKGYVNVVLPKRKGDTKDKLKMLEAAAYFGERALLTDDKRNADIIAGANLVVLTMARNTFVKLLGPLATLMERSVNEYGELVLKSVPLLGVLSDEEREMVMRTSTTKYFEDGEEIVIAGNRADFFFIVKEGEVSYQLFDPKFTRAPRASNAPSFKNGSLSRNDSSMSMDSAVLNGDRKRESIHLVTEDNEHLLEHGPLGTLQEGETGAPYTRKGFNFFFFFNSFFHYIYIFLNL
ncbi:MAG: cyclic nucleotide-binding domain-containing protein [Actinobacteria bacterium]|nr:cyclic nucleotide-binding domain-containing protein [Actinomycetota bacterium]